MKKYLCLLWVMVLLCTGCEKRILSTLPEGMYEMRQVYINGGAYNTEIDNANGYSFDHSYFDFHESTFDAYVDALIYAIPKELTYKIAESHTDNIFRVSGSRVRTNVLNWGAEEVEDLYLRFVTDTGFCLSRSGGDGWGYLFTRVNSEELITKLYAAPVILWGDYVAEHNSYLPFPKNPPES